MKPIISPWLIYFASRVNALKILTGLILAGAIIVAFIAFMEGDIEYGDTLTHKNFIKNV